MDFILFVGGGGGGKGARGGNGAFLMMTCLSLCDT